MKHTLTTALLMAGMIALTAPGLRADSKDDVTPVVAPPPSNNIPVSQEFTVEGSYAWNSSMKQGSSTLGNVNDTYGHVNYVVSPEIKDGVILRLGVDWERNSFGLFSGAPLPNTLQSTNAVIGADLALNDKIIMRVEAHPGIYSDAVNLSWNDFDMPVQIGGTYLYSKDLQFILGIQVDLKSDLPVIGLPGFRWQFADKWVLSAIPPRPQLQYLLSPSVTLYTGGELIGGAYQLNGNFGNYHGHGPNSGNSQLNNAVCDYSEFRIGAGVTWKFTPNLNLDVSGGYIPYRDFNMHSGQIGYDSNWTNFHNNLSNGGPYGEVGIRGSF